MASSTSNSSAPIHSNAVPSEVGWQFVPQYYTYMNKQPNRLHCFYTKNSTFIHGTEGEDVKPCYGQQEIHNKILSIGFTDCKVFIHSVDAQSSTNGGIIIQVIGEMSNNTEAWRKFAQTFFLAEQPNGYFVLNDIFRYLKEESVDTDEVEGDGPVATSAAAVTDTQATSFEANPAFVETTAADQPSADEPVTTQEPVPEPPAEPTKINGYHPHAGSPEPETLSAEPEIVEPAKKESSPEPTTVAPVAEDDVPLKAPESVQDFAPVATPAPAATHSPAPVAAAPPAPKTWANLAAANSNKWGNAVAQEAKGVSAAAAPSAFPLPSGASSPSRDGHTTPNRGSRVDRDSQSTAYTVAMAVTTPQCFVKGVTEVVSHQVLSSTLAARFGPIKEVEIIRSKACAFLEFVNLDSAKRAIVASLPMNQGGEGGIRIDVGEAGQARINVETKKERGDRPPPRPRGGAPTNGDPRGGYRGGRGGGVDRGGRGRGAPSPGLGSK